MKGGSGRIDDSTCDSLRPTSFFPSSSPYLIPLNVDHSHVSHLDQQRRAQGPDPRRVRWRLFWELVQIEGACRARSRTVHGRKVVDGRGTGWYLAGSACAEYADAKCGELCSVEEGQCVSNLVGSQQPSLGRGASFVLQPELLVRF